MGRLFWSTNVNLSSHVLIIVCRVPLTGGTYLSRGTSCPHETPRTISKTLVFFESHEFLFWNLFLGFVEGDGLSNSARRSLLVIFMVQHVFQAALQVVQAVRGLLPGSLFHVLESESLFCVGRVRESGSLHRNHASNPANLSHDLTFCSFL